MVNPLSLTELAKCPNKRTKTLKFLIEIPIIGTLLYNIIHSREAIDEKFVDKYLYDEDTIDYQMTKIYHESAHNENAHSKYLFASIKGGYTKTNIYHCIRKATNSICIISGQYDENSIEIAKQYQKHVPAIECMCIRIRDIFRKLNNRKDSQNSWISFSLLNNIRYVQVHIIAKCGMYTSVCIPHLAIYGS